MGSIQARARINRYGCRFARIERGCISWKRTGGPASDGSELEALPQMESNLRPCLRWNRAGGLQVVSSRMVISYGRCHPLQSWLLRTWLLRMAGGTCGQLPMMAVGFLLWQVGAVESLPMWIRDLSWSAPRPPAFDGTTQFVPKHRAPPSHPRPATTTPHLAPSALMAGTHPRQMRTKASPRPHSRHSTKHGPRDPQAAHAAAIAAARARRGLPATNAQSLSGRRSTLA